MDALSGITVLDLTSHIAGPYTTKVLADLGARVVKVERPGGDPARQLPPFKDDRPGDNRSALFQFLNGGKESIVLDLKHERAARVLGALYAGVDLVVLSLPPAVVERLGLGYERMAPACRAPVLYITNFGFEGPYRDYRLSDTVLYAMGGEMFSHGVADREPLKLGGTAALLQGGAMAAIAALGAIHAWEVHGIGQRVDVSLFEAQIASVDRRSSAILAYRFSGRVLERPAAAAQGVAGGIYPVADGYVEVTASAGNYWNRFVEMVGDEDLRDPAFSDPAFAMSPGARERADAVVYPWMLAHTRDEVWREARSAHAMVAPVFTGEDLYADPVLRERGYWVEADVPDVGTVPMLGRPYVFEKTPWRLRRAAPSPGQDTDAVLGGLGFSGAEIASLRRDGVVA